MAYMSQEKKAQLAPGVKAVLKKYGLKGSIAVRHHMELVVTIKSGKIDFYKNYESKTGSKMSEREYIQVNEYHIDTQFTAKAMKCLEELKVAMMVGNHNKSDPYTDYFNVGWYISINVGKFGAPYIFSKNG